MRNLKREGIKKITAVTRSETDKTKVTQAGADNVKVIDIQKEVNKLDDPELVRGYDVIVYGASGRHEGRSAEDCIDLDAVKHLADACEKVGIGSKKGHAPHLVHLSVINYPKIGEALDELSEDDKHWIHCSAKADSYLKDKSETVDFTVIRSALLNDEKGNKKIEAGMHVEDKFDPSKRHLPREDLAEVVTEVVKRKALKNRFIEVVPGDTDIVSAMEHIHKAQ